MVSFAARSVSAPRRRAGDDFRSRKSSQYVAKEGDKVVVHYSEDAGKKIVHFFKAI